MTKNIDFSSEKHSDIAARIKLFRSKYKNGMTQKAFADILGIDQQRLSSYEMGTRVPHQIIALLVELGANAEWLLFGDGAMLRESQENSKLRDLNLRIAEQKNGGFAEESLSDFYVLPLYADEAAAGEPLTVRDCEVEGPAIIHKNWCPHPGMTDYVRISQSGTSMEPTIPAGSIVTIDRSYTEAEELVGKIVAIATNDGGVTIKRLRKTSRGGFVGEPDNPTEKNQPIYLEEGDRIIGKVTTVHAWLG